MEGVAVECNEIYLELAPENLSRALKTAQNAKAVKVKLTNKYCPCLTVAVELVSELSWLSICGFVDLSFQKYSWYLIAWGLSYEVNFCL